MPELPEVETIRRQLAPRVAGRTIVDAQVLDPLWCAPRAPEDVEADLRGEPIAGARPAREVPVLELADERFLVMHLRMTGNLLWVAAADDDEPRPHLRVSLALDDGHRLLFTDQRRFGTGLVIDGRDALDALHRRAARPGAARPVVHPGRAAPPRRAAAARR